MPGVCVPGKPSQALQSSTADIAGSLRGNPGASLACFSHSACPPCLPVPPPRCAGARVEFPEGEDASMYDMRIIECSYDPAAQVGGWVAGGQEA